MSSLVLGKWSYQGRAANLLIANLTSSNVTNELSNLAVTTVIANVRF